MRWSTLLTFSAIIFSAQCANGAIIAERKAKSAGGGGQPSAGGKSANPGPSSAVAPSRAVSSGAANPSAGRPSSGAASASRSLSSGNPSASGASSAASASGALSSGAANPSASDAASGEPVPPASSGAAGASGSKGAVPTPTLVPGKPANAGPPSGISLPPGGSAPITGGGGAFATASGSGAAAGPSGSAPAGGQSASAGGQSASGGGKSASAGGKSASAGGKSAASSAKRARSTQRALASVKRAVVTLYHGTCRNMIVPMQGTLIIPNADPGDFSYKGGLYFTDSKANAEAYVKDFKDCPDGKVVLEFQYNDSGLRNLDLGNGAQALQFQAWTAEIPLLGQNIPGYTIDTPNVQAVKNSIDGSDVIIGTIPVPDYMVNYGPKNPFKQWVFVTAAGLRGLTYVRAHPVA